MHKCIALVGIVALLLGLWVGLPGASYWAQAEPDEPAPASTPQTQSGSTALEERGEMTAPGSESFLEALAGKLGITVERLEQALKETKKELIEAQVDEWAKEMKEWVDERAKEMKERLAQAEPQRLLRLTKKGVGQGLQERLRLRAQAQAQAEKKLISPPAQPRLPSYTPPSYWPSPCNCTCYCYPNYYYMPVPLQPQQPAWPQPWPWQWFEPLVPEATPQPEAEK